MVHALAKQEELRGSREPENQGSAAERSHGLWELLATLPTLGDLVECHRGHEWKPVPPLSWETFPGSIAALMVPEEQLGPYVAGPAAYLRDVTWNWNGASGNRPWQRPKIVISRTAKSRGPWRIAAAPDDAGLVPSQNFYVAWPILAAWPDDAGPHLPNYLAAILNGAIANAYIFEHSGRKDIQQRTLLRIPVPIPPSRTLRSISSLVKGFIQLISWGRFYEAEYVRIAIDRIILRVYDLTREQEISVERIFQNQEPISVTERQRSNCASTQRSLPVDPTHPWAALVGDVAVVTGKTLVETELKAADYFPGIDVHYYRNPAGTQ